MSNFRRVRGFLPFTVTGLVVLGAVPAAATPVAQGQGATDKVTICHRTNSITNPYVLIEVAASSVDGDGANDRGQGDHFLNHTGPIWTPSTPKHSEWGDIIPPVGDHQGLNWTAEGQAILESGCSIALYRDTDKDAIVDVQDTDDDNDAIPDVTDTDDDGDGTPDAIDPDDFLNHDADGDHVPDAVDPDSPESTDADGDHVPDALEPPAGTDTPAPEVPQDRSTPTSDTDSDGTPDVTDKDDDGDGITDVNDSDADGDGIVETFAQELTTPVDVPKAIEPGQEVVVYDKALRTNAGARPLSAVACSPMTRMRPSGDVGTKAMTRALCDVKQTRKSLSVRVKGLMPTVVTFTVSAPANGGYTALDLVETRVVR